MEESALTAEEEKLLDELETELEPEDASENVLVPEEEPLLSESELPDIESVTGRSEIRDIALGQDTDEELPELEEELESGARGGARSSGAGAHAEVEVTLSENGTEQDKFGDLEALESELASVTTTHRAPMASSAEILSRIEKELRSIRTDLTKLRGELSGLRRTASEPAGEAPVESEAQGGFFDDDEDETIALTGDELDNILNTAEITEEAAEASSPDAEIELPPDDLNPLEETPPEDILSYETPSLEEKKPAAEVMDLELAEDLGDDALVLADDAILPTPEAGAFSDAQLEELPSELVLDELAAEAEPSADQEVSTGGLPEIDLEGIPELEAEPFASGGVPEASEAVEALPSLEEEGSETIDLETLDLGEEPKVIDAVPDQLDELETLAEEETDVEPLEEVAAAEDKSDLSVDALADEVDLEALAAEAEELNDEVPISPKVDDLEIGELETVGDGEHDTAEKEIEIEFESDLDKSPATDEKTSAEEAEEMQELIPELEELGEASEAPSAPVSEAAGEEESVSSIPDNLKDEIRTVLKYMDHLLEALPDEKIQEFASSEYFVMYKKLFEDLGLGE
jgi:hypothetical protein